MADYETLHICRLGYHDANNVSNVGGDPVTQLSLKKLKKFNLSFCIPKYVQCWISMRKRLEEHILVVTK